MNLLTVLRAFVISLYMMPLFASWNFSFCLELIDHDIQDIYIGTSYGSGDQRNMYLRKLLMIRCGYNAQSGYYVLDPSFSRCVK